MFLFYREWNCEFSVTVFNGSRTHMPHPPEPLQTLLCFVSVAFVFSCWKFLLRFLLKNHAACLTCFACNVSGIYCHNLWASTTLSWNTDEHYWNLFVEEPLIACKFCKSFVFVLSSKKFSIFRNFFLTFQSCLSMIWSPLYGPSTA